MTHDNRKRFFSALYTLFCFFLLIPLSVWSQMEDKQSQEPEILVRKTIKYFKTGLSRRDLLETEIDAEEASTSNHFKAVYDHQGQLIRIEFIPNADRMKKRIKKRELFPKPQPPFRYFESWNPHIKRLGKEMLEQKIGDRPFYRASYLDSTHIKSVEYFRRRNRLLWIYYITWDTKKTDSKLSIVFSTRQPLTSLDPHLFHPTASEMKPGWIADFRHNRLNRPLEVTVHDAIGNIYYFYRFIHRFETVGDSLNPVTYRISTSEYYRSDTTLIGSHRLIFSETNNLTKKEFFDSLGKLTETIEYIYNPELQEISVLIRDPKGNILHRQVMTTPVK